MTTTDTPRSSRVLRDIVQGNAMVSVLAVVLALVLSGILIAATDPTVQTASGYFFARPGDTFAAIWHSVSVAYVSIFQGSIVDFSAYGFAAGIHPFTETLNYAMPLIVAGLGVALSFRAGLFNIGGQGQILMGAAAAGWVGFSFHLPIGRWASRSTCRSASTCRWRSSPASRAARSGASWSGSSRPAPARTR